jgi:ubiquinone/menaquinone biosynthesis C-methylase UbiE
MVNVMELDEIPQNYDRAAPYYDRMTDLVFGRVLSIEKYREQTIDLLGDLDGATVLDVGCGTGRNLPFLVERVGPSGKIVALDYSEGMLEQARRRVRANGWTNIEILRGDAVKLEGVPEPVDALTSAWCYGIVHDLEAALNRAVNVLRPNGRLSIMDFGRSRPDRGPLRWLYPFYSRLLQRTGIDTADDLDDAQLQAKWRGGKEVLRDRLQEFGERTYLWGAGLILWGTAP